MFTSLRRTVLLGMQPGTDFGDFRGCRPATESLTASVARPCIGVVIFTTHRGERAEAILDSEGRWRCPRLPVLDRVLNILFEPARQARGSAEFGHAELDRVAAWIKGRVRLGSADAGESS
jgi:hypothetical protein